MKTRMQPIGNVWNKLPRVVRDLAHGCGKQVRRRDGGRRDRARQDHHRGHQGSADAHGAQLPSTTASRRRERRIAAGKPPAGPPAAARLSRGRPGQHRDHRRRRAASTSSKLKSEGASQRGVITAEQAARMSERELLNLIFLPGFSTAREGHQRLRPRRRHGRGQDQHREDRRHRRRAEPARQGHARSRSRSR